MKPSDRGRAVQYVEENDLLNNTVTLVSMDDTRTPVFLRGFYTDVRGFFMAVYAEPAEPALCCMVQATQIAELESVWSS